MSTDWCRGFGAAPWECRYFSLTQVFVGLKCAQASRVSVCHQLITRGTDTWACLATRALTALRNRQPVDWGPLHSTWLSFTDIKTLLTRAVWNGGRDSSVVRAPDSWLKGRGFESLLERRENFLLQGRLSVLTLISVSVPPPCYRSST